MTINIINLDVHVLLLFWLELELCLQFNTLIHVSELEIRILTWPLI